MTIPISALNPAGLTWGQWAGSVNQDLAGQAYNMPNPGEEGSWDSWAFELLHIPDIAGLGLPDPRGYGEDWRAWAVAFTQAVA